MNTLPIYPGATSSDRAPADDGENSEAPVARTPAHTRLQALSHSQFFLRAQTGLRSVFGGLLPDRNLSRGSARLDLL